MTQTQNSKTETQNLSLGYGDYLRFRDLVLERSGLYFPEKKKYDLEIGLLKALAASSLTPVNGYHNLDDYYNLLCDKSQPANRAEMGHLINALTVGETYFFRDEAQFNALATQVLPALIARKRAGAAAIGPTIQPQLRIWSAGCASGEEPYSLAILLKELLPDIANWRVSILATDINDDSLTRARQALYPEWSFREARAKTLRPLYFKLDPTTKRYQLRNDIRQMVTFAALNLIEDNYPAIHNDTIGLDLILCRNVTIYFKEADTQQVVKRFYKSLVNKGWLVVGHSEPSLVIYRAFQACTFPHAVLYQKTEQPTAWPTDWDLGNSFDNSGQPMTTFKSVMPGPKENKTYPPAQPNLTPATLPANPFSKTAQPGSVPTENMQKNGIPFKPSPLSEQPYLTATDTHQLATTLLRDGQISQAITKLQELVITNPGFSPAYSLLGRAYANLNQWDQAKHWCQRALELDNLQVETYSVLALVYQCEEQIEMAIQMFNKAIYLERSAPLPHFNLALLYKKSGQTQKAHRACRNLINILEKWSPEEIVPDTDGTSAKYLLDVARQIWGELEVERKQ